jgi:hypothetical protein
VRVRLRVAAIKSDAATGFCLFEGRKVMEPDAREEVLPDDVCPIVAIAFVVWDESFELTPRGEFLAR